MIVWRGSSGSDDYLNCVLSGSGVTTDGFNQDMALPQHPDQRQHQHRHQYQH